MVHMSLSRGQALPPRLFWGELLYLSLDSLSTGGTLKGKKRELKIEVLAASPPF